MTILNNERIDDLERHYTPIERFEKWRSRLFWASAAFSILSLYSQYIPWTTIIDAPVILFSMSVVVHLAITLYVRFYLIPKAEGVRRKQLLSNSFGVPITSEKTQAYYNNPLIPSIQRLGANVLENSFFAKAICGKMAVHERAKILVYFIIWLIAALSRSTPIGLLVVITQIVFAGEIIARWVSLEVFRHRNEDLFEKLYQHFLHKIDFQSRQGIACILDAFATYEASKAAAALKQSTKIFYKLNPKLKAEWDDICNQLGMNGENPSL